VLLSNRTAIKLSDVAGATSHFALGDIKTPERKEIMGCERWNKHTQKWISFDMFEISEYYEKPTFRPISIDDYRWYAKFAILNHECGRGKAGGPKAEIRGFPDDASEYVKGEYEGWGIDAHSPNWINLEEFRLLASKYRLLSGADSPLRLMSEALEAHIKRKLKWEFHIAEQKPDEIRLVYWFDN
jgi:hypothetical protein